MPEQEEVQIQDQTFVPYIQESRIMERVQELGSIISRDYRNKELLLLSVLNGSFIYAADLMRAIEIPCEISFVKMASYTGTESSGKINQLIGINEDLSSKDVLIVEDIVDRGYTLDKLLQDLEAHHPNSIATTALTFKKEAMDKPVEPTYVGFEVPNLFIIGYGLDYNEQGRHLRSIYQQKKTGLAC